MRFILDTNILLSALIKDSITRKIIIQSEWNFYYPEMSFHEVRKYKELVLKKSGMSETEYHKLLNLLLKKINIVPDERIMNYLEEAKKIMVLIDPDDVIFVATKFSIPDSIIWSDDTDFDKQLEVKVFKSAIIINLFKSLNE